MKCCRRKYSKWSTSSKNPISCKDKKIGRKAGRMFTSLESPKFGQTKNKYRRKAYRERKREWNSLKLKTHVKENKGSINYLINNQRYGKKEKETSKGIVSKRGKREIGKIEREKIQNPLSKSNSISCSPISP